MRIYLDALSNPCRVTVGGMGAVTVPRQRAAPRSPSRNIFESRGESVVGVWARGTDTGLRESGCPVCLAHARGYPAMRQRNTLGTGRPWVTLDSLPFAFARVREAPVPSAYGKWRAALALR